MTALVFKFACILAAAFSCVYYVHMFQLNGYHRDAHLKWYADTLGVTCARMTFAFFAFILSFFGGKILDVISCVLMLATVYTFLPQKAKKPLVCTLRVKRLFVTVAVVYIGVGIVSHFVPFISFLLPLCVLLSNFVVVLCDIINSPVEKAVKHYYINDAKKILSSHKNLTVIGITGSYGKTSTKYFLTKILSQKYNVLMTPASYNTPMGVVKTIREMLKPSHEIFVCEMGAKNIGDIKELCDIVHPDMGIIASVGPQHLESFGTIENVTDTKFELFDAVKDKSKMYLNFDSECIASRQNIDGAVRYGVKNSDTDLKTEIISVSDKGTTFQISYKDCTFAVTTKLLGSHNVQNIAGCIAVALDLGVLENDIVMAVKRLESVPHRLQLIDGGNVTIIDDAFNANPVGTKAALEVMSYFDGVKIIVTPGMIELGDKQSEYNREFGANASNVCDYVFLVGGRIADEVYEGAISESGVDCDKVIRFKTVQEAVEEARNLDTGNSKKYILLENDLPDNY